MPDYRSLTCPGCKVTFASQATYMNHGRYSTSCTKEMRFWGQVDKSAGPDACWLWMGTKHFRGYGACTKQYGDTRAHRVSWLLTHGPIPDGLGVLHKCDTPLCVNPAHLYLGDQKQNSADCIARGRRHGPHTPFEQLLHPQLSKRAQHAEG